jgi:hypothetical protein
MVQIIAPAGWLTTEAATPTPDAAEVAAAAAAPAILTRAATLLSEHPLWAAGAGAALLLTGVVAVFTLSGNDESAALPPATLSVTTKQVEPTPPQQVQQKPAPVESIEKVESQRQALVAAPPVQRPPSHAAEVERVARVTMPAMPQPASEPAATHEIPRRLMLEPVANEPRSVTSAATTASGPAYPPSIETEVTATEAAAEAKPQAEKAPVRVTNVVDQLSVPIESIDLPAMPIGEFVNLVSTMAAVPIKLDAKVLGDVGLSSRSTVTVRGDNTTVGKLLAGVLKEHQLTCVERDGVLVVVKAKR